MRTEVDDYIEALAVDFDRAGEQARKLVDLGVTSADDDRA